MSASKIAAAIQGNRAVVIRDIRPVRKVRHIPVNVHPDNTLAFYSFKKGKMVKWFDMNEAPF